MHGVKNFLLGVAKDVVRSFDLSKPWEANETPEVRGHGGAFLRSFWRRCTASLLLLLLLL